MWPYVNLYAHARWYVIWKELSVDPILNHSNQLKPIETNTKIVLNWILALRLLFNIQSSDYCVTNMSKVNLYSTFTKSILSFGYIYK